MIEKWRIGSILLSLFVLVACSAEGNTSEALKVRVTIEPQSPQQHQAAKLIVQTLVDGQPIDDAAVTIGIRHDSEKEAKTVEASPDNKGNYIATETFHEAGNYQLTINAEKGEVSTVATKQIVVE
ncbi:FixH family protein [Desmospora activa]|uniref:YtkA-like protein n=1 Tax=Desmospora activa DSM 45169 TaxID=1121389 RepID=A0A2T4ZDI7_9BACL|nr:FixH family protein [Desmospora activa]PTM59947.1 YtkA-like protein [Desmospora activa DSM 45169]